MDAEALKSQLTTLKQKAKAARKEGKRDLAQSFKNGAARARRRLQVLKNAEKHANAGKKSEAAAS